MAVDGLKLDATSELRDLMAQAGTVFDKINVWLIKNNRYGYIPDKMGDTPDDPIATEDFAGTAHEGLTAEQFYGVVAFCAGLVESVTPESAKLLARFGKPVSQQIRQEQ